MQRSLLMRGVLAALVFSATVPTTAAADVIVGQLVDSACKMTMGRTEAVLAPNHLKCAIACAQKGGRLAVVTEKGEVYAVTGPLTLDNNARLIPFINQTVVLTGTLGVIQAAAAGLADPLADALAAAPFGDAAPTPPQPPDKVPPPDKRRPTGREDGVVSKTTRTGDFREGDVANGSQLSIEAVSVDLNVVKQIVP